jgi:hypothetical protein
METIHVSVNEERCEQAAIRAAGEVFRRAGWAYESAVRVLTDRRRLEQMSKACEEAKSLFATHAGEIVRLAAEAGDDPREIEYQRIAEEVFRRCGERTAIRIHREECQ